MRNRTDQELLDEAMDNAYKVVMGLTTVDDILDSDKEEVVLPFDMTQDNAYDVTKLIELLVYYYEGEEWYERCAALTKLTKNGKKNAVFIRAEE